MSERKIIKQVSVDAKIYDLSLGEKTVTILSEDVSQLREEHCLGLDVVFNRGAYREAQIENSVRGKQTFARVTSVMPDRPYILEQASKVFAEMVLKQMREENLQEIARRNHVPNWVKADCLFSAIFAGLAISKAEGAATSANKMLSEAVVESDWPLHMRSKNWGECTEPLTEDSLIDCPEYVLFRLNHGESWDMRKVENIKEAQQFISKQGFRNKQTKTILVLHKLEPMPCVLFAEALK